MTPVNPTDYPAGFDASTQDGRDRQLANLRLAQAPATELSFNQQRYRMVHHQLRLRGIDDIYILRAMAAVPRHQFVRLADLDLAYSDQPLAIGYGQTISQPYVVALMLTAAAIQATDKVLEIGAGSGYQTAILSRLGQEVYAVEIIPPLAKRAAQALRVLRCDNVHLKTGNGYGGWIEHAPYDVILAAAASPSVPAALVDQLAPQGRLVMPIGTTDQTLFVFHHTDTGLTMNPIIPVQFVPMTGLPGDRDSLDLA